MIAVTGATGKLGRLVVSQLLEKVPASQVVAAVRSLDKAADLAVSGVRVRHADYDRPETLVNAFTGVDKLLLISSSEVGKRATQHQAAIAAAKKAGVKQILYTSILKADASGLGLAVEHKATEEAIRESGLSFVFLRNGWYLENYTENLAPALQYGAVLGSAGTGRVAAAARQDFAAAAVAALTQPGHENKVYELGGDAPFTLAEYADELSRQTGKNVVYKDLPADAYKGALLGAGLPEPVAAMLADSDLGIARGELTTSTGDLQRLIGRPTTPLSRAIASATR